MLFWLIATQKQYGNTTQRLLAICFLCLPSQAPWLLKSTASLQKLSMSHGCGCSLPLTGKRIRGSCGAGRAVMELHIGCGRERGFFCEQLASGQRAFERSGLVPVPSERSISARSMGIPWWVCPLPSACTEREEFYYLCEVFVRRPRTRHFELDSQPCACLPHGLRTVGPPRRHKLS